MTTRDDIGQDEPQLIWTNQFTPSAANEIAKGALIMMKHPELWIHRRVHRITLSDHETARHQASVDFTLPPDTPEVLVHGRQVYVAPLFLLAKDLPTPLQYEGRPIPMAPYSDIDFFDSEGHNVPLLTRYEGARVAAVMLTELARPLVGDDDASERLLARVSDIANFDGAANRSATYYVLEEKCAAADPREKLRGSREFKELAYAFSEHSPAICLLQNNPGRTIIKLAYNEPTNKVSTPKGAWRRSLGLKAEQYVFALTEVGASMSYHVEIAVPDELELNEVGLIGTSYESFGQYELFSLPERHQEYFIRQVEHARAGIMYIPFPGGRRVGAAWVKLRARRPGFLLGALIASIIITMVLALATISAPYILKNERPEATVAMLLLVPTLLAAYVARPHEHAITSRMLRFARFMLTLDGVLPFLAALALLTSSEYAQATAAIKTAPAPIRMAHGSSPPGPLFEHHRHHSSHRPTSRQMRHPQSARPKHRQRFLHTLRERWLFLTKLSGLFVALFTLSYILPTARGKSTYRVRRGALSRQP